MERIDLQSLANLDAEYRVLCAFIYCEKKHAKLHQKNPRSSEAVKSEPSYSGGDHCIVFEQCD